MAYADAVFEDRVNKGISYLRRHGASQHLLKTVKAFSASGTAARAEDFSVIIIQMVSANDRILETQSVPFTLYEWMKPRELIDTEPGYLAWRPEPGDFYVPRTLASIRSLGAYGAYDQVLVYYPRYDPERRTPGIEPWHSFRNPDRDGGRPTIGVRSHRVTWCDPDPRGVDVESCASNMDSGQGSAQTS